MATNPEAKALNPAMEKAREYRETKARKLTEFLEEFPSTRESVCRILEIAFVDGSIEGLAIAGRLMDQRELAEAAGREGA